MTNPRAQVFHPFRIEDRATLEPLFHQSSFGLCEYSFATQFCWQPYNDSMWSVVDGMLVVKFTVNGQERFICPVGAGDRRQVVRWCMRYQAGGGFQPRVDFVPDTDGCASSAAANAAFVARHDPSNDDYIYLRDELAGLPGKRFSQKRNHIAALTRDHEWTVRRVSTIGRQDELCDFIRLWADGRGIEPGSDSEHELEAALRAVRFAGPLGLDTYELVVDGACCGISICERTIPDMYTVHFEKSVPGIKGAYQAICSGVAALAPADCRFINREQDMGVEGLRKTKRSWNPARMERCWTVFPADDLPPEGE